MEESMYFYTFIFMPTILTFASGSVGSAAKYFLLDFLIDRWFSTGEWVTIFFFFFLL